MNELQAITLVSMSINNISIIILNKKSFIYRSTNKLTKRSTDLVVKRFFKILSVLAVDTVSK